MPIFEEAMQIVDFYRGEDGWVAEEGEKRVFPDAWEQDYHVMVLALRDYMRKTGFHKVLLGLSGGIDSAIVATIAVDALGADNVRCVSKPCGWTG